MRFGWLGPLAVWTTAGEPVTVPGLKVRALLADLLVHEGRPVSADRLADDLWGEELPRDPAGALQAKVSQLRRALEGAEPGGRQLVVYSPPGYLLRVGGDAVDAHRFRALTARARETDDGRARASLLSDALALWRGPALADFGDALFAQAAIARLEEQRLVALEDQAEARLELGEHGVLAGELGDLVVRHPLRERLRAAHLRALYCAGRQSEALASYGQLQARLLEELGVDPSPELVALHEAILKQDPALKAVPTPPASAAPHRTNLPASLTDLVGRAEAVSEVRALLGSGRLVTLTGSGGVGKTRLAVEVAAQLAEAFPDGVWLIGLTALERSSGQGAQTSTARVAEAVMGALGIRDDAVSAPLPAGRPAQGADRLAGVLHARQLLLVLDNCEHVIGAVAELAQLLLVAAPRLRILATSQEPLGISGELLHAVPPLELPDPAAGAEPAVLAQASAVQLFVARAAASVPGFALDAGNARAVAEICRRLDGIPLALELAATRARALGVRELAARLDDRFRLLATGHRGAPARQLTLRAAIDWSWGLTAGPERIVLRRLAVHTQGCTLEAAEEVCSGDGVDAGDVLDLLARLVDLSLVIMIDGPGGARYRLLESVAAYCTERMHEVGELERVLLRHHRYYTDLAEKAGPHLRGHDQRQWLERLDAETANVHSALDSAMRHADADLALRLAAAMTWYWFLRGRLTEARRALQAALALHGDAPVAARAAAMAWQAGIALLAGDAGDPAEQASTALNLYDDIDDPRGRARAEWFLGFATSDFGDPSASENLVTRALAGFRALDDRWGIAAALSTQAKQAAVRGDLAAVRRNGEQSLALFRELGDRWGQLQATEWLGALAETTGDYERATRLHRDGLRTAEELGLWPQAADRLSWLGRIAMLSGDYPTARDLHEHALRLAAEQNYKPGEIFAEIGAGLVTRREGKLDIAEACLRSALKWNPEGVPRAQVLAELGFIAEQRGDPAEARALHLDSFAVARELGDPRAVALALEGLAGAQALAGHHDHAAQLLGAAAAARQSAAAPLPAAERGDVDRITAAARATLSKAAFAAEFERGTTLEPEQARAIITRHPPG